MRVTLSADRETSICNDSTLLLPSFKSPSKVTPILQCRLAFFSLPINPESADNSCAATAGPGASAKAFADEFERPHRDVTTAGTGCQSEVQGRSGRVGRRERRKFGLGKVRQAALVGERLGVFQFAGVVPSDLVDWKDWCEIQQLE